VEHCIFAMELCLPLRDGALAGRLRERIVRHPIIVDASDKWALYKGVCDELLANLDAAQSGCWDYFDDNQKALDDYKMWSEGMITEEGARTSPSGAPDAYRGGDPRYMTVTMAFLIDASSGSARSLASLCAIPEPRLWARETFAKVLKGLGALSFSAVKSDVVYVIPGEKEWGLTGDDIRAPKFHYLRQIF